MQLDPSVTWRDLEARLARTTNPRHRKMLQTAIDHGRSEHHADLDAVMATLCPQPRFHFWADGQARVIEGWEDTEAYYADLCASGTSYFESEKVRIVLDDDNLVTECVYRMIVPGEAALARGFPVPDPDGHYLIHTRAVIFWPFDEAGELIGEDVYPTTDTSRFERVPDEELPQEYVALLRSLSKL